MLDLIIQYIEKRIELLKLEAGEKVIISAGFITFITLSILALSFFIILFNFALSFMVGSLLDSYALGFFIVAGFYLLLFFIIFAMRKKIMNTVTSFIIKSFKD
ncbi:hypothetical protein [Elizabethkingia sp. JS20170427COW]|uniref:hypothetical protein n=1 Tax=Elizabethkingia sp. JS20170427COW TaxID=2583851 RepID=UPI001110D430|nr:hypothetical protein [Elizabethkingia sp. JS20170427COW]QCX52560.1 hypothetical protein FGE20_01755 [Elizabethkingia sp. JS20170427COW]